MRNSNDIFCGVSSKVFDVDWDGPCQVYVHELLSEDGGRLRIKRVGSNEDDDHLDVDALEFTQMVLGFSPFAAAPVQSYVPSGCPFCGVELVYPGCSEDGGSGMPEPAYCPSCDWNAADEDPCEKHVCGDCQREFTPTPGNEKYCSRCLGKFYAEVEQGDGVDRSDYVYPEDDLPRRREE